MAREDALERVDVGTLVVDGQRQDAGAGRLHRGEAAGERRRLDDRHVAGREDRSCDEIEGLARAGRDEDLVRAAGIAGVAAELGKALAQRRQAFDLEVARDGARVLAGDVGGHVRELLGRAQVGVREARAQRDRVARVRRVERVAEHLVGVGQRARREHAELPVVVEHVAAAGGRGRRLRDVAAHERPTPDRGADVAELGEPPVHAHGGEVVDVGVRRELAGRRQLGARRELAAVDELGDVVDELLRHRGLAVALEVQHTKVV